MSTIAEKEVYLDTELVNCSLPQKQRAKTSMFQADKYHMFPTDIIYKKWVSDTKSKLEYEAKPDELAEVFKHFRL